MNKVTARSPKLKISEIFLSIQGESTLSGLPFIFVRLAECNLRCSWCDTRYAYQAKREMTLDAILKALAPYQPIRHVLITGGEPLCQRTAVIALMKSLVKTGYAVSLETNGSLPVKGVPVKVKVIMDLKPPSSGEVNQNLYANLRELKQPHLVRQRRQVPSPRWKPAQPSALP